MDVVSADSRVSASRATSGLSYINVFRLAVVFQVYAI